MQVAFNLMQGATMIGGWRFSTIRNRRAAKRRAESSPPTSGDNRITVTDCYNFFDAVYPVCGLRDLTEGMYFGDPTIPYELAQRNQAEWLLDEAGCRAGSRLLDIGCGYGTLMEAARRRGSEAVGITISPPQVMHGLKNGLDVRLLDYRHLDDAWNGRFDAVIANGSAEHFVHPRDLMAGKADDVYHELFRICHRVIDPHSASRRFVTTTIHRNERTPVVRHDELLKSPFAFRWRSGQFHYAMLQRTFGGYYPDPGQLARCARPCFALAGEVDGTADYRITTEQCLAYMRRALVSFRTAPRIWRNVAWLGLRRPRHTALMCLCLFVSESWQYQFRGPHPPTTLLRQTWDYCPHP